jgi:hypothetical protein
MSTDEILKRVAGICYLVGIGGTLIALILFAMLAAVHS